MSKSSNSQPPDSSPSASLKSAKRRRTSKVIAARLETAFGPKAVGEAPPFRVAFFGGSFDPPHLGHLQIAAAAADRFSLDQVWFEPAGQQPLKDPASLSPYVDRLAMTRLACASNPRFVVHEHDAPRRDGLPNYTVDALIALNNSLSHNDALFCIVGVDAFRALDRWHRPVRLLGQAHWIIAGRPGFTLSLDEIRHALPPCDITPLTDRDLSAFDCVGEKFSTRLYLFDAVHVDISSTQIREGIRAGAAARTQAESQLPPAVADYIRTHNLYV
jgi:nicotinate-nucleotide adenylyltransferase